MDEVDSLADEDALVMVIAAAEIVVDRDESDAEVDVAAVSEDCALLLLVVTSVVVVNSIEEESDSDDDSVVEYR